MFVEVCHILSGGAELNTILETMEATGLDLTAFIKISVVLLLGTLITGLFGRFIFGKRSTLNKAVSSAIGIVFIYAVTVLILQYAKEYASIISPLPYVTITDDKISLFQFRDTHYALICSEALRMIILAFLVNLIDGWMPKGKNVFTWLIFRSLTVILAFILHYIAWLLIAMYVPENIMQYAPVILLVIMALLLLTGALKIPIGALLVTINPIIGGLYTFFFANIIGKEITKAVFTTTLLTALFFALNEMGYSVIALSSAALMAYIPFIPVLFAVWYLVYRIL